VIEVSILPPAFAPASVPVVSACFCSGSYGEAYDAP